MKALLSIICILTVGMSARPVLVWAPDDWYRYQGTADPGKGVPCDSSPNQGSNCGPACVAMCVQYATGRWVPIDSAGGKENVRYVMMGRNEDEGCDWPQVEKALKHYGVPYRWVHKTEGIKDAIRNGHPVMAMVQCEKLAKTRSANSMVGRYYEFRWGHFLMVRGMSKNEDYFVCYDPQVFVEKPEHWTRNGEPRGRDVLYPVELFDAASVTKLGDNFPAIEIMKSYDRR